MHTVGYVALNTAAGLIGCGGLYDIFLPRLPGNLSKMCGENTAALKLVRELLRALGGSLVAVGATAAVLINVTAVRDQRFALSLVLLLVLPAEGINAFSMRRVGSPFYLPLGFALLTLSGVLLA